MGYLRANFSLLSHQAALLTSALTRQAAAVVTVGTYSPGNLLLRCGLQARWARWREVLRRPQREERGGAYCGGSRTACVFMLLHALYEQSRRLQRS